MNTKKNKIIHFRNGCIGCNSCTEHAPGNWEINPVDGRANLRRSTEKDGVFIAEISELEIETNKLAARDCPVGIIHIENERGENIVWE